MLLFLSCGNGIFASDVSYDLGMLSENVSSISIKLNICNDEETILKVVSIKGECSCFSGYIGPKEISKQSDAEFVLKFDIERFIAKGSWETSVVFIGFHGGDEFLKIIHFKAAFEPLTSKNILVFPKNQRMARRGDSSDKEPIEYNIFAPPFISRGIQFDVVGLPDFLSGRVDMIPPQEDSLKKFIETGVLKISVNGNSPPPPFKKTFQFILVFSGIVSGAIPLSCEFIAIKTR